MNNSRKVLHQILVDLLGSRNVYFQPPASVKMQYPAIVYSRSRIDQKRADDRLYSMRKAYTVTVIDADPDSGIPDRVAELPLCRFSRHFKADNLNHDVYDVYF